VVALEHTIAPGPNFADALAAKVGDEHADSLVLSLLVARLATVNRRVEQPIQRALGLERSETIVLLHLSVYDNARIHPSELARSLGQTSGGVTKTLRRMEARGLVQRVPDPADRRAVLVELTNAGQELADRYLARRADWAAHYFGDMKAADREGAVAYLCELVDRLARADLAVPSRQHFVRSKFAGTASPRSPRPRRKGSRRQRTE
jgi:DNA-binding MarR family transcriptional regulator